MEFSSFYINQQIINRFEFKILFINQPICCHNLMLKQRHSTQMLSSKLSKTLSRPKFINKQNLQTHTSYMESGKQIRTLRQVNKNKSCYIPKHLAQSTQSHIEHDRSMDSKNNKSTAKNYSVDVKNKYVNGNFNHRNNEGQNYISSNFNIPEHHQSVTYQSNPYSQFLSLQPTYNLVSSTNIQPKNNKLNLIQLTNNYPNFQIPNLPSFNPPLSNLPPLQQKNLQIKQSLLQKQIKQMFLHKNKQLTKVLQQMHKFCISVKQLKWICEEVHHLIKVYNEKIGIYYREYFAQYKSKADIENMVKESEQLLKRFNQLSYFNSADQRGIFNFNLFSKDIINEYGKQRVNSLSPNHITTTNKLINQNYTNNNSYQNQHSWSNLIQNIHKQQKSLNNNLIKPFECNNTMKTHQNSFLDNKQPLIMNSLNQENNKNNTIRTFQITEHNSPFKNKTLNQLIRLSELRKSQFNQDYGTDNKENSMMNGNRINVQGFNNNNNFGVDNNKNINGFQKYKTYNIPLIYQNNRQSQEQSLISNNNDDKDPFDSIHLPHFNTKNIPNPQPKLANNIDSEERKKYQNQIKRLNKQIQLLNRQNNQYMRKINKKKQDLQMENRALKDKNQRFQSQLERIKQRQYALNEQFEKIKEMSEDYSQNLRKQKRKYHKYENCVSGQLGKALNQLIDNVKNSSSIPNKNSQGYYNGVSQRYYGKSIMMKQQAIFSLIDCLDNVLKFGANKESQNSEQNDQQNQINTQKNGKNNTKNPKPSTNNHIKVPFQQNQTLINYEMQQFLLLQAYTIQQILNMQPQQ